jgi:cellulase
MASTIALTAAVALLGRASAQQIGTITPEIHPTLTTYKCTTGGGCIAQDTSVVIDWNYHWMHTPNYTACDNSAGLDPTCSIEGADYAGIGVATSGTALTLHQYVLSNGTYSNSSPRVYLLDPTGQDYDMLKLLGQEISYDVDASALGCGENGALYLSEM